MAQRLFLEVEMVAQILAAAAELEHMAHHQLVVVADLV
jgi:hypothetical protein